MECECYVGMMFDYENTDLITREELEEIIEKHEDVKIFTRKDYCDKRITTNVTQFNYCPKCGKKIDWKAIKLNK